MLAKLKAAWTIAKSQLADIWNRSKVFVITVGALILALEFQKIKEALLVYAGKKEIQKDKKEDQALATQEKTENAQADAMVKEAQQLPGQEPPVQPDWYKDKK